MTSAADDEFDDAFGGEGMPTQDQVIKTRDFLKRHNRKFSIRPVQAELTARGFSISIAQVQRKLKEVEGGNPPDVSSGIKPAVDRMDGARDARKREAKKPSAAPPVLTPEDVNLPEDVKLKQMVDLLVESNTSTQLAIMENRHRMALNIVIMERMAATPSLLMLDLRGTAAAIDALTVASKLSGGASIDITIPTGKPADAPTDGVSPGGHPMKTIPATGTGLSADLEAFRRRRAAESAQRA